MARTSTKQAERQKRLTSGDPAKMTWEEYLKYSKEKFQGTWRSRNEADAKARWDEAQLRAAKLKARETPAPQPTTQAQSGWKPGTPEPKDAGTGAGGAGAGLQGGDTGSTPGVTTVGDYQVYVDKSGNPYVTGKGGQGAWFTVPGTDGTKPSFYNDINEARTALTTSLGTNYQAFLNGLRSRGYITDAEFKAGVYTQGIDKFINDYSVDQVNRARKDPNYKLVTIDKILSYIPGMGISSGATASTPKTYISSRQETDRAINQYMVDNLGRNANQQEKDQYYAEVNGAERKATVLTTKSGQVGNPLVSADYALMQAKVAQKSLAGTDVDTLLKSATPGAITSSIARLQAIANAYGVSMTAEEALKKVAAGLGQDQTKFMSGQEESIKRLAQTLYPTLAAHIQAGGNIKDVADQYASWYTQKTGVAVPNSILNKNVMNAVTAEGGPMAKAKFDAAIQGTPEWRTSPEAYKVANDFANAMSQMWGVG